MITKLIFGVLVVVGVTIFVAIMAQSASSRSRTIIFPGHPVRLVTRPSSQARVSRSQAIRLAVAQSPSPPGALRVTPKGVIDTAGKKPRGVYLIATFGLFTFVGQFRNVPAWVVTFHKIDMSSVENRGRPNAARRIENVSVVLNARTGRSMIAFD
jgi:hypothetical protein